MGSVASGDRLAVHTPEKGDRQLFLRCAGELAAYV
jgi:hypothetical protein